VLIIEGEAPTIGLLELEFEVVIVYTGESSPKVISFDKNKEI